MCGALRPPCVLALLASRVPATSGSPSPRANVDLQPPVSWLTGHAYRGRQGIAEWLRDLDESFSFAQIAPLELTDLGDRVLAITRFDVEGHESRASFGSELGLVLGVENGRITSWVGFMSHADARAAARGERTIQ